MKINQLWASALALLALAACGKDIEPSPTPATPQEPQYKLVQISLTAGQGESNNLRVLYDMDLDPQAKGAVGPFRWSDKNKQLKIRVAVRRGTGDAIMQDLIFDKKGSNQATYQGSIAVPTDGAGSYSISGVLLAEVGTEAKTFMRSKTAATTPQVLKDGKDEIGVALFNTLITPTDDGLLDINVPYITRWQPLDVNVDSHTAKSTMLQFEPQGTVLRLRIKNESTTEQTFHRIQFTTNNFINGGVYYFNFEDNDDAELDWFANNRESLIYTIPGGVVVPGKVGTTPSYSRWFYLWLQPRKTEVPPLTTASLSHGAADNDPFKLVFMTKQKLAVGSVPMTLVYTEGGHAAGFGDLANQDAEYGSATQPVKLSIEYLAPYVLNAAGTGFVKNYATQYESTTPETDKVGFFYAPDALARFAKPFAIPAGASTMYSLPTRDEMVSIIPPMLDGSGVGARKFNKGLKTLDVLETNVKIGVLTRDYLSDYYQVPDGTTLYALRFKESDYCTAFRYTIKEVDTSRVMAIDCILVGKENITLDDLSRDDYWTTNKDRIVSRYLPLYGTFSRGNGLVEVNDKCYYMTSTKLERVSIYTADLYRYASGQSHTIADVTASRFDRSYPIMLMKR